MLGGRVAWQDEHRARRVADDALGGAAERQASHGTPRREPSTSRSSPSLARTSSPVGEPTTTVPSADTPRHSSNRSASSSRPALTRDAMICS